MAASHSAGADVLHSSLVVGIPLLIAVFTFLRASRSRPAADPLADAQLSSVSEKIFSARSTRAPGFTFVEVESDHDSDSQTRSGREEVGRGVDTRLAQEASTLTASVRRAEELKSALAKAVAREDYESAAALKRELDQGPDST